MDFAATRVPVLPREVAAGVIVIALNRGIWAIGALELLFTIPGLVEVFKRAGYGNDLFVPLAMLTVILGLIGLKAARPSSATVAVSVIGGGLCVYAYLISMLGAHPELQHDATYLLNRPALAVAIVGAASSRPLNAVAWGVVGYVVAEGATILAYLQSGLPVAFGAGPTVAFLNYCALFVTLEFVQRSQRGRIPDFGRLQHETRRMEHDRKRELRAIALVHDTVLNDLALVINGPHVLDARIRARLREDVATLARGLAAEEPDRSGSVRADAHFRNEIMSIVSDLQWRGLGVDITGNSTDVLHVSPEASLAGLGAVRACLENVLVHSGASTADVVLGNTLTSATVMVIDSGVGFEPSAVAPDRLGLRGSVIQRIEAAGGSVRIWSTPGRGTSVLISIPLISIPLISIPLIEPGSLGAGNAR